MATRRCCHSKGNTSIVVRLTLALPPPSQSVAIPDKPLASFVPLGRRRRRTGQRRHCRWRCPRPHPKARRARMAPPPLPRDLPPACCRPPPCISVQGVAASTIAIAAASAGITASPMLLLMVVVVSSVAPRLLHCPPFEFVSPRHRAIVNAFTAGLPSPFANHSQPLSCCSFTEHQWLSPLPLMVGCCILRPPLPMCRHYSHMEF